MIVGIVGSRKYTNYEQFEKILLESNIKINKIVSGGATGVDTLAETYAKKYNIPITIYPADWKTYGKKAGPMRNTLIVNDIEYLIALPDKDSVGTYDTINKAKTKGITILVKYI